MQSWIRELSLTPRQIETFRQIFGFLDAGKLNLNFAVLSVSMRRYGTIWGSETDISVSSSHGISETRRGECRPELI